MLTLLLLPIPYNNRGKNSCSIIISNQNSKHK